MSSIHSIEAKEKVIYSESEQYTIIKLLGSGAFGKVYAVKDSSGKPFALKLIKQADEEPTHIFLSAQREFERGQMLNSSRIIKSYDFFAYGSKQTHCIVLEYVNGKSLALSPKRQSKKQARKLAVQLIKGLKHAASVQLYHIDLHGGNLMITKNDNLKIIDLASFITWEEFIQFAYNPGSQTTDDVPIQDQDIVKLEEPIQNDDFRLMHKLAQFCNQPTELTHQFQEMGLRITTGESFEHYEHLFIQAYLTSIHSSMMNLLNLGKFDKQDLCFIQKNWEEEIDRFLEAKGGQLKLEDLPNLFDRLESIL